MGRKRTNLRDDKVSDKKNKLLTEIYNSGKIKELLKKIGAGENEENLNDLEMDIYLYLCEYEEEKLFKIWESGDFNFWASRVICNQIHSATSKYFATYKRMSLKSTEMPTNNDDIDKIEDGQ